MTAPRVTAVLHRRNLLLRSCAGVLFSGATAAGGREPRAATELFEKGIGLFFAGKPIEAAAAFDAAVALDPASEPALWQRGLALYYAGRFEDGRLQFERHRAANPDDVENAAWHFACVARVHGAAAAMERLLPVGADRRIPMREILDFYAGRGRAAAVLSAAERGPEPARRNQLCFAHLYLGLHAEAVGDSPVAKRHIALAAGQYRMDHFMGRVAVLHATLRNWPVNADDAAR